MLSHVVLPNGQPIRVRLDSGVPFLNPERECLLEEAIPAPPETSKGETPRAVCVLGSAIVVFLLLALGVVVVVLVLSSEVRRVSDLARVAFPSTQELSAFVHTIMDATTHTALNVEQMSALSTSLLGDSARAIRATLNATHDLIKTAGDMITHPPPLQLALGRSV